MNDQLKDQLRAYYATETPPADPAEKARVIELVAHESCKAQAARPAPTIPFWRFILAQVRFIHPASWVLQIALLAGLRFAANTSPSTGGQALIVMTAGILSVAIGLPSVFKSFETGVTELECACRFNCTQVLVSRLAIFGLTDILWLSIAFVVVPAFGASDPFRLFLYACTPFFACCAVCFYLARIVRQNLMKTGMVAIVIAIAALWGAGLTMPQWYTDLSLATWSIALIVSIALATYELRRLFARLADGLFVREPIASL